jgi:magnesium transporter
MIRLRYHPPGTPPATLVVQPGRRNVPPDITLVQYDATSLTEDKISSVEELGKRFDKKKVNWINIEGLGDIPLLQALTKEFGLHAIAMEDAVNTTQRAKAEHFGDHFFILTDMIYEDGEGSVAVEQVSLFMGANFVITLQEEKGRDVFAPVRARLRAGRGYARRMKADYLAYALLDATVDQYFPILENIGDAIEGIEDVMLEKPTRDTLRRLYECKRLLLQIRRAAWPQREIFSTLIRDDTELVSRETQVFLRDCYDHSTQIIDILESYRDLAAGLMDVYLSSLGFRTNEIMRVLTVVSVLFIPLTFLAGVYGMNFDTDFPLNMPELKWPFGYIFFWCVSALIVGGMITFFKRKHWL